MKFERYPWRDLSCPVVGLDEVGRGCLAGPVVAAAAILPRNFKMRGLTDSKLLSEKRREEISEKLTASIAYGIGIASVEEIETHNILRASLLAMKRAVEKLELLKPPLLLVDGLFAVPDMPITWQQVMLTKGELKAEPIAAASVIAKVARDRWMLSLSQRYPAYGFDQNKGYGTVSHREALQNYGPTPYHRREFAGVREFWPVCLLSNTGLDL